MCHSIFIKMSIFPVNVSEKLRGDITWICIGGTIGLTDIYGSFIMKPIGLIGFHTD